jgi:hypothetical protein
MPERRLAAHQFSLRRAPGFRCPGCGAHRRRESRPGANASRSERF